MTSHTLHLADNQTILPALPDATIDTIMTDPPYGTGRDREYPDTYTPAAWQTMIDAFLRHAHRLLKPSGVCFTAVAAATLGYAQRIGDAIFTPAHRIATLTWTDRGQAGRRFTRGGTDYILVWARDRTRARPWSEPLPGVDDFMDTVRAAYQATGSDTQAAAAARAWARTHPDCPWAREYRHSLHGVPARHVPLTARGRAYTYHVTAPDGRRLCPPGGWRCPQTTFTRLAAAGLDASARSNLIALLREQRAATGVVPSDTALVLERCEDESGSLRLILHSPFGRRVHEPWAMGVRERVQSRLGIEPQVVVADDGIILQLPATTAAPGAELVTFDADELTRLVRSRIEETALFAARFRECAARALLMPGAAPGHRAPLWLQRIKAGQLLEASRQFRDFPVALEAARECLQDVYDLPALASLMERIAAGAVRVVEATTRTPSPFAHPLLFGYTAALLYQEDLPHAERRARLLSLDPDTIAALVGDAGVAELLDAGVLARVEAELQRLAPGRRARPDAGPSTQ